MKKTEEVDFYASIRVEENKSRMPVRYIGRDYRAARFYAALLLLTNTAMNLNQHCINKRWSTAPEKRDLICMSSPKTYEQGYTI